VTARVTFEVLGVPKPQGSKSAFRARDGRIMVKESNPLGHAQWRNAVSESAIRLADEHGVMVGPIRLDVVYRFPMPASRSRRDRLVGEVWKTTAPDRDKLDRCVCDALEAAGLIGNDALVCAGESIKVEVTGWTGASITLTELAEPKPRGVMNSEHPEALMLGLDEATA